MKLCGFDDGKSVYFRYTRTSMCVKNEKHVTLWYRLGDQKSLITYKRTDYKTREPRNSTKK